MLRSSQKQTVLRMSPLALALPLCDIWKSRLLPKYYPCEHVAWKTKINLVLFRYGMFPAAELFYWSRRWSTLEIWVPNTHAFKEGKQLKCCWKIRKMGVEAGQITNG